MDGVPGKEKIEDSVLRSIFSCMVDLGLENVSIRNVREATGLNSSSLYYRFSDKDEMVLQAAAYGFLEVTNELFWIAAEKIGSPELAEVFADNLDARKRQLKFLYQIALSPLYGEAFRGRVRPTDRVIEKYNGELAAVLGRGEEELLIYTELFVSAIRDYVIWEDRAKLTEKLNFLYAQAVGAGRGGRAEC